MQTDSLHLLLEFGTAFVVCILAYLAVRSRAEQAEGTLKTFREIADTKGELRAQQEKVRTDLEHKHGELIDNQNKLITEFNQKHAENTMAIAVHQAEDKQQFEAISRTLTRMDGKLDKIANGGSH